MKLAQEETMERYDGCCNHQLLPAKKPKKSFSTKSNFPNPIGKCKKEENAIRFFKSILYFIQENHFSYKLLCRGQQCSDMMQKGGGMWKWVSKQVHR